MSEISTDKLPVPRFPIGLPLLRLFFRGSLTRHIRRGISQRPARSIALTDSFPHLGTMDRDRGIASKPSLTLPFLISSTVTLSMRSKRPDPPTTTDSMLFLDRTNIVVLHAHD